MFDGYAMLYDEVLRDPRQNGEYRRMEEILKTYQKRAQNERIVQGMVFRQVVMDTYKDALRWKETDLPRAEQDAQDLLCDELAVKALGLERVLDLHEVLTYDPNPQGENLLMYTVLRDYLSAGTQILAEKTKIISHEAAELMRSCLYTARDGLAFLIEKIRPRTIDEEQWFTQGNDTGYLQKIEE